MSNSRRAIAKIARQFSKNMPSKALNELAKKVLLTHHDHSSENNSNHQQQEQKNRSRYCAPAAGIAILGSLFGATFLSKKHDEKKENGDKNGQAIIYTWEPKEGCIGHQSMLIKNTDGEMCYVSFWPTNDGSKFMSLLPPATKLISVKGQFLPSIELDIEKEGNRFPNNIIIIENLDFAKMNQLLSTMQQESIEGKLIYSLFRKFSLPSIYTFFTYPEAQNPNALLFKIDPMSETLCLDPEFYETAKETHTTRTHNCTSLINSLMVEGGYPKPPFNIAPYHSSPIGQHWSYKIIGGIEVTSPDKYEEAINLASAENLNRQCQKTAKKM